MSVLELLIRITSTFFVLFMLARITGRKEISQMTFFNWVSAISIGSIAANVAVNQNLSLLNGVLALVGWTVFTLVMGFIDIKSKKGRKLTTGEPVIVIKNGQIMDRALRQVRLDLDSLRAMLRKKNVFQLSDVDLAIFETNGQLSVMKKDMQKAITKGDMNVITSPKPVPVATEFISDGAINYENLTSMNLDQTWLNNQLQQAGMLSVSDVFLAELQQDGTLYIDKKEDGLFH